MIFQIKSGPHSILGRMEVEQQDDFGLAEEAYRPQPDVDVELAPRPLFQRLSTEAENIFSFDPQI